MDQPRLPSKDKRHADQVAEDVDEDERFGGDGAVGVEDVCLYHCQYHCFMFEKK